MPVELQIAVGAVALLGFGTSLFLAYLRWVEWRARPDLRLDMDWIVATREVATLRVVASNRGKARGGVRDIIFSPTATLDGKSGFYYLPIMEQLPVMLDPGHYQRFNLTADPNSKKLTAFETRILKAGFTHAVLIDADRKEHPFPLPPLPAIEPNRRSTYGRVSKR